MTDREKLEDIRKALQGVIDYPTEEQGRRTDDGYPSEFAYYEFAYKRMVDSFRNGLKTIIEEFEDNGN